MVKYSKNLGFTAVEVMVAGAVGIAILYALTSSLVDSRKFAVKTVGFSDISNLSSTLAITFDHQGCQGGITQLTENPAYDHANPNNPSNQGKEKIIERLVEFNPAQIQCQTESSPGTRALCTSTTPDVQKIYSLQTPIQINKINIQPNTPIVALNNSYANRSQSISKIRLVSGSR